MIKLVASDMDGTLLDSKKRLPADLVPVVKGLKEKGATFVVASGRQYDALRRDLDAIAKDIMFIAENGALVVEDDEVLFLDALPAHEFSAILEAAKGLEGVYACVCGAHCAVCEDTAARSFIDMMQMFYPSTKVVPDLAEYCKGMTDVCKIAFFDEGDAATHLLPVLEKKLSDRLAVILSSDQWVDVMKPGVDKGRAMQMVMQIKGARPEECMAFGDYLNDLQLLEAVGESYAMENALPQLKAAAKYVAPSNDDNGVLRVIRERFSL